MGSAEVVAELTALDNSKLLPFLVGDGGVVSSSLNKLGEEESIGDCGDEGVEPADEGGKRCGTEMAVLRCNQT